MRTRLPETLAGEAREVVETALRACVHCGMGTHSIGSRMGSVCGLPYLWRLK